MSETTEASRLAQRGSPPTPSFGVQLPILFVVFLFFAAGDLFALHTIEFGEGKYRAYRDTFRAAAAQVFQPSERPSDTAASSEAGEAPAVAIESSGAGGEGEPRPGAVGWTVFSLLFLPALLISLRRRDWAALGFGMAAIYGLGLGLVNKQFGLGQAQAVNLALGLALPVSFAWLVFRGKVWSPAHGALLILTYPFVAAISPTTGGVLWSQVLPFFSLHLSFVVLLLLVRTVWLILSENLYVVRQLGLEEFIRIAGRTLWKWSPILLLAVPYFTASYMIDRETRRTAYGQRLMCAEVKASRAATDETAAEIDCARLDWREIANRDLEADTLAAVRAHFGEKIAEWRAQIDAYRVRLKKGDPEQFSYFVGESYDRVFTPGLGLKPPKHGGFWSFVTQPAAKAAQDSVEKAYDRKHRETRRNLVREADDIEPTLEGPQKEALKALDDFERESLKILEAAREATLTSVQGGFFVSRAFDRLTLLLFCVLCVRTLFYVFARVACAREAGTFVTLGDPEGRAEMPTGTIARRGAKLSLEIEPGDTFYIARRFQPHGKAPKFALPQANAAPFPRLRNRCYTMNAFTRTEGRGPVQFTATRGAEFVEWRLAEQETVVFEYRNFVGMSDGVRLSALISARVTSQIFGRFIFPTATGPGTLILMTEGAPYVGASESEAFSMPPSRLVAWQQPARFHIDSELGMLDIYFSEAYVEPQTRSALIMDVDRQDSFGTGLSRFVRRFLLPI